MAKRKIRWQRLLLLFLPVILIIAGIGGGIYATVSYFDQKHREEIKSIECPKDMDPKLFAQVQQKALDGSEDYETIVKNIDAYSNDILEFSLEDPDRMNFVLHYPQRDNYKKAPVELDVSLSEVPYLCQWDLQWGYTTYGEAYFYQTGCAPVCLSMIFSYLLQDSSLTPTKLANYAEEENLYVDGIGTDWNFLTQAADQYGIKVEKIAVSSTSIEEALSDGKMIVSSMLPGDFTQTGHFIMLAGLEDGKVVVHDPNSPSRTQKLWDLDTIASQTQGLWAYSI